jgi:hypothetical protein
MGIFESGFNDYKNIPFLINGGYEYFWDNYAMAPWLFNSKDSTFWTFDDQVSVALKTRFAYAHNLRGLMFWEISGDDSTGTLVNTIYTRNISDIKKLKTKIGSKSPLIRLKIFPGTKVIHTGTDLLLNINELKVGTPLSKVEYFVDNKSIGYNTKAPFSWAWFNVSKGKHKLTAFAIDSEGHKKYSKKISINVK